MLPSNTLALDRILRVAESLPGAPRVLQMLQDLLGDPNSDLDKVAELMRHDAALTARVIRVANGAVYSRGSERVASIEEALARVGFNEVHRLAGIAVFLQLSDTPLFTYGVSARALREHSLFCGFLMEQLAPSAGLESRGAYTTGLLNAVGRVVLDATAQRDLRGRRLPPLRANDLLGWEREVFGWTSADIGARVLNAWRFPADVMVAVRDQLLHGLAVDPLPAAKLLHIALARAESVNLSLPGVRPYTDAHAIQAQTEVELTSEVVSRATQQAWQRFERFRSVLE